MEQLLFCTHVSLSLFLPPESDEDDDKMELEGLHRSTSRRPHSSGRRKGKFSADAEVSEVEGGPLSVLIVCLARHSLACSSSASSRSFLCWASFGGAVEVVPPPEHPPRLFKPSADFSSPLFLTRFPEARFFRSKFACRSGRERSRKRPRRRKDRY